jgi:site-specific recombinase XerD
MTKEQILVQLKADLEARGLSTSTVRKYTSAVRVFQEHFGLAADRLREPEIMAFQRHLLTEKGLQPVSVNDYNSAFRFLYGVTLDSPLNYLKVPKVKFNRRLPQLFSREEIARIIDCEFDLAKKAMFMLAYGSGLRLSEITNIKVSDIESDNMRILVREGKGNRDRYALLPLSTLIVLRKYWIEYRPDDWLFVAPRKGGKYSPKTLAEAFKSALSRSGVTKPGSLHLFRHCFATHLYEDGHNLLTMKKLLGHSRISTTAWYTQIADSLVSGVKSPIDSMCFHNGQLAVSADE